MPVRYSGGMTIRLTLKPDDSYRYSVSDTSGDTRRGTVNAARVLLADGIALDSSEAFDQVARAALAFALDEKIDGCSLSDRAEYGEDAAIISRKAPKVRK